MPAARSRPGTARAALRAAAAAAASAVSGRAIAAGTPGARPADHRDHDGREDERGRHRRRTRRRCWTRRSPRRRSAGPTIEASWYVPWSSAFADGRRSASSVRGRNACCAGMYRASAAPKTAPSSASSGIDASPVRTSAAIAPTTAPRIEVRGEHQRRATGRRSARTPNGTQEHGARHGDRDQHGAQREARAGQRDHQPRQRDEVELVADDARSPRSPTAGGSRGRRARAGTGASGRARWRARSFEDDPHAVAVVVDLEHRPAVAGAQRLADAGDLLGGQARDAVEGELAHGDRQAQVDDLAAGVGDLDPQDARAAAALGARCVAGREARRRVRPEATRRLRAWPADDGGGPSAAPSDANRRGRRGRRGSGAASSAVSRPSTTSRRTSSSGSAAISAPAPEEARAGVLEDLELVRGGLDVEVAALERPEDLEAGGLAAIGRARGTERRLAGRGGLEVGTSAAGRLVRPIGACRRAVEAARQGRGRRADEVRGRFGLGDHDHRRGREPAGPVPPAPGRPAARPAERGAQAAWAAPPRWRRRRAAGCRPRSSGPTRRPCPRPRPASGARGRPRRTGSRWRGRRRSIDCVSTRTALDVVELHVAADRADHVVPARAEGGVDPDVAAGRRRGEGVEPGSADREVARHGAGTQLDRRRRRRPRRRRTSTRPRRGRRPPGRGCRRTPSPSGSRRPFPWPRRRRSACGTTRRPRAAPRSRGRAGGRSGSGSTRP